ncbi:MAG TPA: endonuclease/exonuclease/phosphatase family protein [Solirubrobacteraceae bacterium]|nr:endonuclease/exonuclease/phosphatase family protein [Solirubrobacteraceae bacterium]
MPSIAHPVRILARAVAAFAVALAVIGVGSAHAEHPRSVTMMTQNRLVTVMTQNLYQGTEFRNIQGLVGGAPTLEQALAATTADYATYVATRFKDRATQIAAEIAQNRPVLVGLQEVATWHMGAFDPAHPFALPAPVSEDFVQELVAALAADGMRYAPVSRHDDNFTLAFPIFTPGGLVAVGMVESGVILARTDLPPGQLKLSNPQSGTYNARVPLVPNPLDPDPPHGFQFTNSWQSIDAKVRGTTFRFITTHLDALAPGGAVSGPQAQELLGGPANTPLPMILAGDMNSGPQFSPAAYDTFLAGGLTDTWTAAGLGAPPLTCCHLAPNDLASDPNATYSEDDDHVFIRGKLGVVDEHLVGDTAPNPAPASFIWPSDHAGMVATLAIGSRSRGEVRPEDQD